MQIVYEQQQNFKVEAVAVLERYFSPTQDGECGTAESEAKRICQTTPFRSRSFCQRSIPSLKPKNS